jgi:hypothetical protein
LPYRINTSFIDPSDTCLAIVDSGTSGLGIPTEYYQTIVNTLTSGKECKDLSCIGVKEADFPVILISLEPDNIFPLMPADYIECSGMTNAAIVKHKYDYDYDSDDDHFEF